MMTELDVQRVAEAAVERTLLRLGIDGADPGAFAGVKADLVYVRSLREASAEVKKHSLRVIVGIVLAGIAGVLWLGFKSIWN